ncbi:RhuM family protein [Cloacibacillus evryensis]|uniref:RhuM family protein n=1 Tax=Cloacibacillus evryensis TaxID=508460 RepID=UPI00210963DA|nr:RhuM family protein [Cloacibacillus evryensis]MCQ4765281.1 virulence RhuM family protein [Cloacibacillus evryensis]
MTGGGEIILYQAHDGSVKLEVQTDGETVWLNRNQMAVLFDRDVKTIGKHVNNALKEELDGDSVVANFAITAADGKTYNTEHYSLDMIISVGYRVKSRRGVDFRRWAGKVLKDYVMKGYAVNDRRMAQLGAAIRILRRAENRLDAKQVLSVVESYTAALDILDDYDHQKINKPDGRKAEYVLSYDECRRFIDMMKFADDSPLFGNEKDDSFKSSLGAIYQSFGGEELYPSVEEKAANLLYFVTKNHSFSDGNKRIAAAIFLYFLDKNGILFHNGQKLLDDYTLVAVTIMIAESKPQEKETMTALVMNFLNFGA